MGRRARALRGAPRLAKLRYGHCLPARRMPAGYLRARTKARTRRCPGRRGSLPVVPRRPRPCLSLGTAHHAAGGVDVDAAVGDLVSVVAGRDVVIEPRLAVEVLLEVNHDPCLAVLAVLDREAG